jgi:hypothetical protein
MKTYGYVVSCPRIPKGRYFKTKKEAMKEMDRQMRAGASQSGIREVMSKKEWENRK